jgi:hypothetical protein
LPALPGDDGGLVFELDLDIDARLVRGDLCDGVPVPGRQRANLLAAAQLIDEAPVLLGELLPSDTANEEHFLVYCAG